jgi:hypothetical protein
VSLGILLTGFYLGLGPVTAMGAIGLGLTATTIGALAIAERRLVFIRGGTLTPRPYRYFIYEGFAAIPYGLAFLVAGLVLGLAGAMYIAGLDLETQRAAVLARPHLVLLPVGAYLLFHGLGFVIGFRRAAASWSERLSTALAHLPAQLGGLILMALAVGSLALGLTEWLRPDVFRQEFQAFFGNPWPFDPATNDTR